MTDKNPGHLMNLTKQIFYTQRLSHVFRLVPNLFWIVVEDAKITTKLVKNVIDVANLTQRSVLLHALTPPEYKLKEKARHYHVLFLSLF